jgi:hypothetical protein
MCEDHAYDPIGGLVGAVPIDSATGKPGQLDPAPTLTLAELDEATSNGWTAREWWVKRHPFCVICPTSGVCCHPDHEVECPDHNPVEGF